MNANAIRQANFRDRKNIRLKNLRFRKIIKLQTEIVRLLHEAHRAERRKN